jgi:hypothetical protein
MTKIDNVIFAALPALLALFGGSITLAAIASGAFVISAMGLFIVGGSVFLAGMILADTF